jgi:hypothetical protein
MQDKQQQLAQVFGTDIACLIFDFLVHKSKFEVHVQEDGHSYAKKIVRIVHAQSYPFELEFVLNPNGPSRFSTRKFCRLLKKELQTSYKGCIGTRKHLICVCGELDDNGFPFYDKWSFDMTLRHEEEDLMEWSKVLQNVLDTYYNQQTVFSILNRKGKQ